MKRPQESIRWMGSIWSVLRVGVLDAIRESVSAKMRLPDVSFLSDPMYDIVVHNMGDGVYMELLYRCDSYSVPFAGGMIEIKGNKPLGYVRLR